MAKIKIGIWLILTFVIVTCAAQQGDIDKSKPRSQPTIQNVIDTYTAEIGVRELTGHNDGERVETYLRIAGVPPGNSWCAAFVNYAFVDNGIKAVRGPAWAPSWFPTTNLIYKRGKIAMKQPPNRGDVFGIYFESKKRIAHVGFIDEPWNNNSKLITTVEGNTNEAGSREGDGVYRKRRIKSQIYAISSNFI